MSKICSITGKKGLTGNNVSHANNRSKRKQLPNLQKKRIWLEEEKRYITLKLSTEAIKTIDKKGIKTLLKKK
ncbi:MAG: 50S ribosomal protein L28 [Ignavibacteria bacterium]|jgi:large subunit ribosomal protein L28|nr:50S ribosomal protein L28 [Ignavibacteria bacterium]